MKLSLDQLCRGVGNPNIKHTLNKCNDIKTNHRFARQGYTKSRDYRHIGEIPMWVKHHPEFSKYFDPDMDQHERTKNLYAFLRKYGQQFMVVDKL